jgi:hypothetical protein
VTGATPVADLLGRARKRLGPDAALELEHEMVDSGSCRACGHAEEIIRPAFSLPVGAGRCPRCDEPRQLHNTHAIDDASPWLGRRLEELNLPDADVIVGRAGLERTFFVIDGDDAIAAATGTRQDLAP